MKLIIETRKYQRARRPRLCFHRTRSLLIPIALLGAASLIGACAPDPGVSVGAQMPAQMMDAADRLDASAPREEKPQAYDQEKQDHNRDADSLSIQKDLWRVDRQGAVEVAVQPFEVSDERGGTILFEVSMNTHSVDLSMDLSALSTLSSDLGDTIHALSWTGGSGHHVGGYLSFPLFTPEGTPLLDGSQKLVLTIESVDAQQRVFEWDLVEMLQ